MHCCHTFGQIHRSLNGTLFRMSPLIFIGLAFIAYRFYKARYAPAGPNAAPSKSLVDPNVVAIVLNTVTTICGIIYLVTLNSGFRVFAVGAAAISSVFVVVMNYGLPQVSRQAIRVPLQEWFGRCLSGAEFPFLFFALMFIHDYASQVGWAFGLADYVAVLILVRRSVWFLGTHASKSSAVSNSRPWQMLGNPLWTFLKLKEPKVLEISTLAEVLIGFWLVLLVLTPARQLLNTFVYWTFLRVKYMAPRSRPGHLAAWQKIDARTKHIRVRIPAIERLVQFAVQWFNQGNM